MTDDDWITLQVGEALGRRRLERRAGRARGVRIMLRRLRRVRVPSTAAHQRGGLEAGHGATVRGLHSPR